MKADNINVADFMSMPRTQFVIPVYQRNYEWTHVQCKKLIDDIIAVGTSTEESIL